ncbi:MAG: acetate--CoA ligase family protein, partial [Gammaproteobacteria bacterium]|nr:acetate--CoA ligase family protein [Gammaproteobacteria bacterium]
MNLHEYQAKAVLRSYGVPVPDGSPANSAKAAREVAKSLGGKSWMVKAQVHAGGRGKVGGVKRATSLDQVSELAKAMLGTRLVTNQTTAAGQPVNTVLVEATTEIGDEFYLSMLVDRSRRQVAIMASAAGGMNIEEVAAKEPDKIVMEYIDPAAGLQPYQVRRVGFAFGL